MRGLKWQYGDAGGTGVKVALYTSAWIEMFNILDIGFPVFVALYTSAWIEIGHARRWMRW